MSLKGSKTKTSFIEWDSMLNLVNRLERDHNYKFGLLIALGCFTGLRIGDILELKWQQILSKETFTVIEGKTGKARTIKINSELNVIIKRIYKASGVENLNELVFINRFGNGVISVQYVNRMLKDLFKLYKIKIGNVSTHLMRKTFGRRVWEVNNHSEKSLVMLGEVFNHSTIKVTKIYLGIREEEIADIYDSLSI